MILTFSGCNNVEDLKSKVVKLEVVKNNPPSHKTTKKYRATKDKEKKMAVEDTLLYPLAIFRSYIKMIKNSVGSKVYRSLYFKTKGKSWDVLGNGNLSCAYFVSTVLRHFDLIKEWRTSVDELVVEMKKNGWKPIKKPKIGSVIVWGSRYFGESGQRHGHIGFYIGKGWAISTSSKKRCPVIHDWRKEATGKRKRKIIKIFWHPKLKK